MNKIFREVKMITINGKQYPPWSQFVERKKEWIGGILEETEDSWPKMSDSSYKTKITDIILKENGKDSAFFEVQGKDFNCGFDTSIGRIGNGEAGWITFIGYGGHCWRIKKCA